MTITELIAEINARGIRVRKNGDDLVLVGAQEVLDASFECQVRSHKAALLDLLENQKDGWGDPFQITPEMLPLVQLTQEEIDEVIRHVPGGAANVQDIYSLAPLQEGILFHHLMNSEGDPYLLRGLYRFRSRLYLDRFIRALQAVVDRHDILRTAVLWEGLSEPVQVVWREAPLHVEEVELDPEVGDIADQLFTRFHPRRFRIDVQQAPLLHIYITHDSAHDCWFMMQLLHHLIADHSTLDVMHSEIEAHLLGKEHLLPPSLPFRNLIAQARLGVSREEHEVFFRKMLGDVDEPTAPFGLLDVRSDSTRFEEAHLELSDGLARTVRAHARRLGVSTASLCHLAWARVLSKVSGREDVVFGTVLFGRMQGGEGADRAMGLFINTLPIRISIDGQGVEAAVRQIHGNLAELLCHEHASLALAQRCSAVPAPTPLFSALLNYRHSPHPGQLPSPETLQAWEGIQWLHAEERTNYPFTLSVNDLGKGLSLDAQVSDAIGPMHVCDFMRTALESLVSALETSPVTPIHRLEVLPRPERHRILYEWNDTKTDFPSDRCVHELFEEQVRKTPAATAVVFEDRELSYAELNARANQLAHYLRDLGVRPDSRVAICVERGFEMIIALIAVLKAGGAYVPLDPAYPPDRLRFMLDDSTPLALLTQTHLQQLFTELDPSLPILHLDASITPWINLPHTNPVPGVIDLTPLHLAYVIYTSGSTGIPKGVMVHHRGLVNRLVWMQRAFELGWNDMVLQKAPFGFDVSVWEFFWPIFSGARLVIAKPEGHKDPAYLSSAIREKNITVLHFVPSMLESFLRGANLADISAHLRVVCSGEPLSLQHLRLFYEHLPGATLHNLYGPTEAAIDVTSWGCSADFISSTIPIGRPIANTQIYILDSYGEPVPVGVAGELYIGGAGVARGYLNRPELTAERFLKDPFVSEPDARMYRTGDLGRWLPDGNIEFLGRNDFQVKIRGYRIELGEIEARLMEHAAVREAVVMAREDSGGDKRLVAYYTATDTENGPGAEVLRAHLSSVLPEYMVPAAYVRLVALPLTPNGKLDRGALPTPDAEAYSTPGYEAPQGELETRLAQVWAEILGIDRVGRHDNFFQLGGHSLLAVRTATRLQHFLGVEVKIRDLFTCPVLADLARTLDAEKRVELRPITPTDRAVALPLSFAQQRLWFLAQMDEASTAYNISFGLRLKGQLDKGAFRRALDRILIRHEALRTTFAFIDERPVQRIAPAEESRFLLVEHDLRAQEGALAELERLAALEAEDIFDLECGPLIRGRLIRLGEDEHALLISMHHIVSDGWSMGVLLNELSTLYAAFLRGEDEPLPKLEIQYADYAVWQRKWIEGDVLQQQAEYWKIALTGIPVLLELPSDHPRPAQQNYDGAFENLLLDERLTASLKDLSRRHGTTLFMTLLAAWATLLSRLSGQHDIVIGAPVANRGRAEIENLIGFFINTLALRLDLSGSPSVAALLQQAKLQAVAAQQHQDLPFEQVVELINPVRSLSHSPLFQCVLNWQDDAGGELQLPGLEPQPLELSLRCVANCDLTLWLQIAGNHIVGGLEYATSLFASATIQRYLGYFRNLLQAMVADDTQAVDRLPLLDEEERRRILYAWNDTKTDFPSDRCIHQLFEEQVEKSPNATAVVFEDRELSYAKLNARANQLAHYLRDLGVRPDSRVAICVERGFEMIIALIAVLKAGGAYVPLDPAYPPDRLRFMLDDSTPLALLTQTHLQQLFTELDPSLPILHLDASITPWINLPHTNPVPGVIGLTPLHLAYVIYTSGSTGIPKGVMVHQKGMANHLQAKIKDLALASADVVAQTAPHCFDISIWQFLAVLLVGGRVLIVSEEDMYDGATLLRLLNRGEVTVFETVPSMLRTIIEKIEPDQHSSYLRWLLVTGESLSAELTHRWKKVGAATCLLNAYGPTECSDDVTHFPLEYFRVNTRSIPIGRPIANTQIYILDSYGEPVPVGVAGELYIGGAGVARGYLNRPELTAERFLKDPFVSEPDARMYRTGDLGRWLPDGNIEFLGRNDFQVKIRGYRIELGEIEARLMEHAAVREAVVMAREDSGGDKRLVAYYTATDTENGPGAEVLRAHLSSVLPEYMVPAAYVRLVALPLTPNGKLDRGALPTPDAEAYSTPGYEAPQGELETRLAQVWAEILGIDRVGRHDNFFQLGGHSLLAVRVIARVRRQLNIDISITELFAHPVLTELAGRFRGAAQPALPAITPTDRAVALPLSFAQQRLWFLAQMDEASTAYNISFGLRLKGQLDKGAFRRALDRILIRHEALRTTFAFIDERPVQRIAPAEESRFLLVEHDLRAQEGALAELERLAALEAEDIFDLECGPLIRGRLIRLGEDEHALLISMHHIVSDGWSMGVLLNELSTLYAAFLRGEDEPLPKLEIQYADYAVWQRKWIEGDVLQQQAEYWKIALTGIPVLLELPSDHPRPAQQNYDGAFENLLLDERLTASLKDLSRRHGTTLFMTLLAAWATLLSRLSGQHDIVIGAPVANRGRAEIENLIGFFINTLALRLDLSGSPSVAALLQQAKLQAVAAQQHQDLPFEQVVELINPVRSLSHSPLFQVMFAWQNVERTSLALPGLDPQPLELSPHRVAKFDLILSLAEHGNHIVGGLEYATSLFASATIQRYLGYFRNLLQAMVADDTQAVDRLPLLDEEERRRILYAWNDTKTDFPSDRCIHQLFEEQVEKSPNATAVVFEDRELSYAELNARANQLAHYLRDLGVRPDSRVAICVERGFEMIIALIAVLKAGGAYVPLDPAYPPDRLRFMLDDSTPLALLTQTHLQQLFTELDPSLPILHLDASITPWINLPHTNPVPGVIDLTPLHLAYVIYTSGSTGIPKGVMVHHRGLVNRLVWMQRAFELGWNDMVLQKAPFGFDVSVWEFFWPIFSGARLVIAKPEGHKDPAYLSSAIREKNITVLHFVPSMLESFLRGANLADISAHLRVVCSGEPLSLQHLRLFYEHLPGATLHNLYGPTEAAIDVTSWGCSADFISSTIPIGRPIANTQIYILDSYGEPVPVGVAGELYIGGAGVARGYLNRPELTAERFLKDPFVSEPDARMYRTGDLGRWLPDGNIEFLGRNDFQVKIRGYRIELGEIEARLMEHAAVREAVVMAREDSSGDKRLVAYYTATDTENGPGAEVLRAHLSSVLPEYMVPAAYVRLVALPLTPNGKLDRGALPTPDAEAYSTPGYEAPQGELETRLAQVWAEILGIDRVGRHDNFFQLGGHSLLAVRVIARVRRQLNIDISITELFAHPVLTELAGRFRGAAQPALPAITPTDRAVALPLSFAQQRLWFLAQMDEASTAYNISFGLRLKGQLDKGAFRRALDRILIRHEALRTTFAFIDERPVQRIAPAEESRFLLVEHDLRAQEGALAELERLAALEAEDIFDLECGPLIRGRLIRLGEDEHALLISMHHIVSDGWSMGVLLNELSTLYAAFLRGEDEPLPKLEIQYADYAVWQRKWIEGDVLQQQAEYWKIALTGIPVLLELPSDHPRPAQQNYDGAFENLLLDERLTASLKDLSRRHGTTLFMTLLAAWATLLSRLSGQHDIVIGAPAANRGRAEIENLIGFFINTLALRLDLSGSPSVAALLQQAKLQAVAAQQHQDLPFEQVVELINPVRSLSHSPLFQCVLNWQDDAGGELQLPGLEPQPLELSLRCVAKVDLWLSLAEHGNHIVGGLEYATSLFASATIQRYLGYFRNLLQAMVADDTQAVDRLPLLDEEERRRILYAWNDTKTDFPSDRCIHQLFEEQVEKSPNATAVVFEDRELSYAELNARANQLAHYLRDLGVRPDSRVAICVERGFEMIIALIAVLKAGGAYVPLDPAYPPDRLRFMLDDSTPLALLTQTQFRHLFAGNSPSLLLLELDDFIPAWLGHPQTNPVPGVIGLTPLHLAYVIYTSGSTGIPKGVMGHHRGLCNLVISQIRAFAVSTDSRVLQFASFSFDASISEIMMALCRGAILFLVPPKQDLIGEACATSSHHAITHATFPPAVLAGLPEQVELDSISVLIVAGETLMHSLMQRWTQRHLVINAYGPTEATICAALHRCVASKSGPPPIGRPIANTQIYILDSYGEPVPVGVAGELYIGGAGVARGYLNRPELTAERFLKDPFVSEPDARMYRTGDLGRWLPDGNIEFLGRNDFQVKIRGYRIELGEIEARLMEHAAVREAVVMAHEDSGGDKRLVAYYTATDTENGPGAEVLRAHLSSVLPEYMVPAAYVRLVALPLTPNGKLDRGALPTPDAEAYPTPGYEAPQGELETRLAQVWAEILGIDRVGRHDNFFQLGGHSLLAVRVIARVRRQLNIDISITELFAHPVLTELAGRFRGAAQPALPAITPTDRAVALPLSFAQQRLWFLAQMDEASTAYNISFGLRLKGQLDKGAFRRALDRILIRHEALRTTFAFIDERPVQRIAPAEESRFLLVEHDLRAQEGALAELERLAALEAEDIFDLECGPLIRGRLIRLGEDEHALLISMHHIVSDGWSMGVLLNELSTLYAAFLRGEDEPLPKLEIQYADYAVWQRKWIEGDVLQQQAEYWKIALTGIPVLLELPSDHPRPAQQNYDGAFENLLLDERLTASLKDLSRRHGTTLFMTLLAAWATLLSRLSGQHDIVIGAPVANRGRAEIENLIGFFINTLALRLDLSGSPSVAALLQQAKLQAVAAQQHQDLPFEQVVELINPVRSLSHSPLFQVMFAWQNVERTSLALPGLDPQPLELSPHRVAKFDLILSLAEHGNHIVGGLEYATSLFASATIQRYLGYFRNLLQAMVADDTQAVDRLPLLDEEERRRILYAWNDTKTDFPSDRCIHQLFEEQVEKSPNATAVVFEDRELSYAELNARANQLAHYLRDLGVRPDSRVAICVERGFEMIIALIAVLKAGGAYVPLDPAYPPDRLRFMLDDSTPLALLTQTHLQQLFTELDPSLPILHLDASITPWINLPHTNPVPGVIDLTPLHLAYVIYTSGSTGIPKGVMVHQKGMANHLQAKIKDLALASADVVAQTAPHCFDISIWQFLAVLLVGGRVLIVSEEDMYDGATLLRLLNRGEVTVFETVPSMLRTIIEKIEPDQHSSYLRWLLVTGESLSAELTHRWKKVGAATCLLNAYGPTECSDDVTHFPLEYFRVNTRSIPIGRPIANTQIYILDSYWEPVPVGVAGELYIGGAGVARGYLNRPELTAERFLKDPFVSEPDARMYRTGDLGRWLPDGNIEFLGRNDFQVKIRGYRIELGEIEARLMEHAAVREAVVMAREDSGGDKRLVAYYTATDTENGPGAEVLRAHLSSVLPEYMVPAAYVRLVALPLTPNGKLDRGALPTPDAEAYPTPGYEAPQGELETRLAQVWAEILGIDRVGRHDDFFQLGGHSLLAVTLIERLRHIGLHIDVRSLFMAPTVAQLGEEAIEEIRL